MPNVRQKGKRTFTFWLPMELHAKFANVAKAQGLSMSELMTKLIQKETVGVSITQEQLKDINRRMKNAAVTPADIAGVIAENTATIVADAAFSSLSHTVKSIETASTIGLKPIPKLGARKKKRP